MPRFGCFNDFILLYLNDFTSRIVAKSGIASDRFHLGKMILQGLRDAPDFLLQIDGGTGKSEKNESVLKRTIKCALALAKLGLKKGDVMVLIAPMHIDLAIPYYAALYLGIIVTAIDRSGSTEYLRRTLNLINPKIIFGQDENVASIQEAVNDLSSNPHIVTFDGTPDNSSSFANLISNYSEVDLENFQPIDFNAEETIAFLIQSSGTTGEPKSVAVTHKNFAISAPYIWLRHTEFPSPTRMVLIASSLHWVTAYMQITMSPIVRFTRLQSSLPLVKKHTYYLINTYKPTYAIFSSTILYALMHPKDQIECDFSSFEFIQIGGSIVPPEFINEVKTIIPEAEVTSVYGISEAGGMALYGDFTPVGSVGKPLGILQYRLVDEESQEDVDAPYVNGELWIKGPGVFKEYYNDPQATAAAFADGKWFKTGDLFYRDENFYFYFVERIKLQFKYNRNKISPLELENVIRQHPSVLDVAVVGIPDLHCGNMPVACVIKRDGHDVTANDIKDLVIEKLSERKQLAGGVIFMKEFPVNAATKADRRKLKEMAPHMDRL